jgi:hypothetical protein
MLLDAAESFETKFRGVSLLLGFVVSKEVEDIQKEVQ